MGAVLTPVLDGLETSRDLAHACTLNGRCQEVCPVQIPLPTLLRGWRDRSWRDGLEPAAMRFGLGVFTFVASRPRLYRLGTAVALRVLRLFGRGGWIRAMPGLGAWTAHRDFPAPQGPSFMARYARGEGADR
jgi:L-lactate dehydrogenase complex protein LldF